MTGRIGTRLAVAVAAAGAAGAVGVLAAVDHVGPEPGLWAATLLAGVAAVATLAAAVSIARERRELLEAARRLAGGDTGTRLRLRPGLGELNSAFDGLAERLRGHSSTLAQERDLLASILEEMQDGVLLLDDEDRVVMFNAALREILLLPADAAGKLVLEVIRHSGLQALLSRVRDSGKAHSDELDVGGLKPRRLLVKATPLRRQPKHLLVLVVDVTEQRRLESLRRDFVANVSHELRTPVTAIRSAAETLEVGAIEDAETRKRFLSIIDRNAERLHSLVEDILELSRIESRKLQLAIEGLAVEPVAAQVYALLRERAEKKQQRMLLALPADLPPVAADRRAIEQILTNLVDNAIKYCPPGTRITTGGSVAGGQVRVSVEDTGPGIDERHLARVFERFYRVDPGRSRDEGGTGLGLSIVKHLVEVMGGEVGVSSPFGQGTTFWFTLPIWEEQSPAEVTPAS